ncbi:MAG TPA: DUF2442 domain-containing protein [Pyrinomonadaceae bacterium]|nr:DUF2442 domain-containing protein [Pyrinomonadaceae bacterium]
MTERRETLLRSWNEFLTADVRAQKIVISDDTLAVALSDGRSISVPLAWYPRLLHGTPEERHNWRPIGNGEGLHWPDLDEDISVENLLQGKHSSESQRSFEEWLKRRIDPRNSTKRHEE